MPLEHLFDAELTYRAGLAPLAEHGEGQLIGSGDGTVRGKRVRGLLRWTLFEGPGELACTMNPALAIRTEDGATIGVQARGDGHRASQTSQLWLVAATLLFSADQGSYAWLDGALGVWEGEFNADQGSAPLPRLRPSNRTTGWLTMALACDTALARRLQVIQTKTSWRRAARRV